MLLRLLPIFGFRIVGKIAPLFPSAFPLCPQLEITTCFFEASDPERNQPRPPHVKQFGFKSRDSSRLQSHYANELEKLGVAHHHHQSAQESPHKNGTQKGGVYESSAYSKSEFRG